MATNHPADSLTTWTWLIKMRTWLLRVVAVASIVAAVVLFVSELPAPRPAPQEAGWSLSFVSADLDEMRGVAGVAFRVRCPAGISTLEEDQGVTVEVAVSQLQPVKVSGTGTVRVEQCSNNPPLAIGRIPPERGKFRTGPATIGARLVSCGPDNSGDVACDRDEIEEQSVRIRPGPPALALMSTALDAETGRVFAAFRVACRAEHERPNLVIQVSQPGTKDVESGERRGHAIQCYDTPQVITLAVPAQSGKFDIGAATVSARLTFCAPEGSGRCADPVVVAKQPVTLRPVAQPPLSVLSAQVDPRSGTVTAKLRATCGERDAVPDVFVSQPGPPPSSTNGGNVFACHGMRVVTLRLPPVVGKLQPGPAVLRASLHYWTRKGGDNYVEIVDHRVTLAAVDGSVR